MMRVVILGSGQVAGALGDALWQREGVTLVQLYARNKARGKILAQRWGCDYTDRYDALVDADLYIIAVSDRSIGQVAQALDPLVSRATTPLESGINSEKQGVRVVVHTSGCTSLDVFPHRMPRVGVLYPLQTFSEGRPVDFATIPLFIEGRGEKSLETIDTVARQLSTQVHIIDSHQRQMIHLSAVFVCNFVNHLYAIGDLLMQENHLSFELLKPLILETAQKALSAPCPQSVQTGPAVRGDAASMERHLQLLKEPHLKTLYQLMSEAIAQLHTTK